MSGYVRRVTADPGSDVRVNRAGSVIVEDNTFDSDAKALRDSEYVPRVYSKDKPDARAGYEDGGYDPARSKADEILRRVERSAKRQKTTKDEGHRADVARSLGLADVAPYGMTLEPGAGAAARRGEAPFRKGPRARRRAAADEDAERRKKLFPESVPNVPNRAASVRRRAPRANAAEPRAAGAADAAGPAGAIRRRRVRVSVPKAASSRFAGAPRGASAPSVSRRVLSGKGAGKDANDARAEISSAPRRVNGETGSSDRERRRQKRDEEDDDAKNANTNDSSSLWSSANERSREAPVSALRGVGAKIRGATRRAGRRLRRRPRRALRRRRRGEGRLRARAAGQGAPGAGRRVGDVTGTFFTKKKKSAVSTERSSTFWTCFRYKSRVDQSHVPTHFCRSSHETLADPSVSSAVDPARVTRHVNDTSYDELPLLSPL